MSPSPSMPKLPLQVFKCEQPLQHRGMGSLPLEPLKSRVRSIGGRFQSSGDPRVPPIAHEGYVNGRAERLNAAGLDPPRHPTSSGPPVLNYPFLQVIKCNFPH